MHKLIYASRSDDSRFLQNRDEVLRKRLTSAISGARPGSACGARSIGGSFIKRKFRAPTS